MNGAVLQWKWIERRSCIASLPCQVYIANLQSLIHHHNIVMTDCLAEGCIVTVRKTDRLLKEMWLSKESLHQIPDALLTGSVVVLLTP